MVPDTKAIPIRIPRQISIMTMGAIPLELDTFGLGNNVRQEPFTSVLLPLHKTQFVLDVQFVQFFGQFTSGLGRRQVPFTSVLLPLHETQFVLDVQFVQFFEQFTSG